MFEAKIEESEKASSRRELNPGFSTTCAVHIEDCGGWWLSGCHSSVAEDWRLKPDVLGTFPGDCWPFHFPLFLPHNIQILLKRRLFSTNLSSENNLPMFRLNAPVVFRPDDDWSIQSKRRQVIFRAQVGTR